MLSTEQKWNAWSAGVFLALAILVGAIQHWDYQSLSRAVVMSKVGAVPTLRGFLSGSAFLDQTSATAPKLRALAVATFALLAILTYARLFHNAALQRAGRVLRDVCVSRILARPYYAAALALILIDLAQAALAFLVWALYQYDYKPFARFMYAPGVSWELTRAILIFALILIALLGDRIVKRKRHS